MVCFHGRIFLDFSMTKKLQCIFLLIWFFPGIILLAQEKPDSLKLKDSVRFSMNEKERPLPLSFLPQIVNQSSFDNFHLKRFTFNESSWNDFNAPANVMQPLWA
jgi:hypothetical protein